MHGIEVTADVHAEGRWREAPRRRRHRTREESVVRRTMGGKLFNRIGLNDRSGLADEPARERNRVACLDLMQGSWLTIIPQEARRVVRSYDPQHRVRSGNLSHADR